MNTRFGEYLKKLRDDRGLSLREVEAQAGISNAYLSQIERGSKKIPHYTLLSKLAKVYGVTVKDLLEKAERNDNEKNTELPTPDVQFISNGYQKLSNEQKKDLTKHLKLLLKDR